MLRGIFAAVFDLLAYHHVVDNRLSTGKRTRTRRSHARFVAREASYRIRSLADNTTNIPESEFSVYTTCSGQSSRIPGSYTAHRCKESRSVAFPPPALSR